MREISDIEDIRELVHGFYSRIREDDLLGPVFNTRIGDRWPEHLDKMVRFWQTVLLSEHTYQGAPFAPHIHLPVEKEHFDHWLELFFETVDAHFTGTKAAEAKWRANKMAEMFQYKIAYFRSGQSSPLL